MRLFYEQWDFLDANSSVTTDESSNNQQSSVATDELQSPANQIDIYRVIAIPNITDFPIESFFSVPFSHHVEIYKKVHDLPARYYYIHRTAEEHLSVEELERLIKQQAYEHQDKAPNNFVQTLSNSSLARKAVMMFKDSYTLEFINTEEIGVREAIDVDERVVEQRIVENIKKFIMTFGNDFAFVGNQYHLEVHGVEHFPDLLFFNRELNALVVVELKTGEFKSSYLGQLMGYLSILDAKVKKPHENPSIGIVLCKSANKDYVQFVIKDYSKPMGVATYTTAADMPDNLRNALPDIEQLRNLLSEKEY
jgi:predicted nuclease of restriction endonuclease-like (RecB) superfamily